MIYLFCVISADSAKEIKRRPEILSEKYIKLKSKINKKKTKTIIVSKKNANMKSI